MFNKNFTLLLFIFGISFILFGIDESFAVYNIGIKHDKTCQALITVNDTETCPTFDQIKMILPNVQLKEQYANFSNNIQQDKSTIIKNNKIIESHTKSCILYNQCQIFEINPIHKTRIWYDPSEFLSRSMDTITISANMKIKNPIHLKYDDVTIITENNKREIHFEINQLYITQNCKDAIFDPHDDWHYEISSLFNYMWNDCLNSKLISPYFDLHHTEQTDITAFDPNTSPNYHYNKWLESVKESCKVQC